MIIKFTDETILKWNKYLEDNDFFYNIKPKYTNGLSKMVEYYFIEKYSMPSHDFTKREKITTIPFKKVYSIEVDKFDVFEKHLLDIIKNGNTYDKALVNNKEYDITLCDYVFNKTQHNYCGKEYFRVTFSTNSLLHNIMYLNECIEISIKLFESSINSIYKVDDIVSIKKDRSKNFVIINIVPELSGKNLYEVLEILSVENGIIKYSDAIMFKDIELCPSRDNRISKLVGE